MLLDRKTGMRLTSLPQVASMFGYWFSLIIQTGNDMMTCQPTKGSHTQFIPLPPINTQIWNYMYVPYAVSSAVNPAATRINQ